MINSKQKKWWEPNLYAQKMHYLTMRNKIIKEIRSFFDGQDFAEVDTPALQISPGLEVHLKAFKTQLYEPLNGTYRQFYLHTSPEFTMKKLLAAGLPRIFQICKVFRNESKSERHHPEFTMLEWYRANTTYESMIKDTIELTRSCAKACHVKKLRHGMRTADPFEPWQRLTIQEAFLKYTGINLLSTIDNLREPNAAKLKTEAQKIGIRCANDDRWEDVFFRIMLNKIEDNLGDDVPTILCEYPTCLGALARQKPNHPEIVERFEVYVCGIELCNAFSELTDIKEQRTRFTLDMDMKEKLYGERYPIDEDFMDALEIMPAASGNAIGVDRLIMLITGANNLSDVLWAPVA